MNLDDALAELGGGVVAGLIEPVPQAGGGRVVAVEGRDPARHAHRRQRQALPRPGGETHGGRHPRLPAGVRAVPHPRPGGQVQLARAQHDPATAESFRERYRGPRREQERALLARAIDAGEIAPRLGPDAALVGPIVYCALTGSSVPRGLVSTLVDDVLKPRSS
jgi:hypothetical protein